MVCLLLVQRSCPLRLPLLLLMLLLPPLSHTRMLTLVSRLLLKYVSRDAVDVLDRGTRGAPECRATLVQYDEKKPLYGFLLYRRRRVLVKYTPDGTSRLLLGTSTVRRSLMQGPVQGTQAHHS